MFWYFWGMGAGVDFMKPFRTKFTDEPLFCEIHICNCHLTFYWNRRLLTSIPTYISVYCSWRKFVQSLRTKTSPKSFRPKWSFVKSVPAGNGTEKKRMENVEDGCTAEPKPLRMREPWNGDACVGNYYICFYFGRLCTKSGPSIVCYMFSLGNPFFREVRFWGEKKIVQNQKTVVHIYTNYKHFNKSKMLLQNLKYKRVPMYL
jgi:hypothetical protein